MAGGSPGRAAPFCGTIVAYPSVPRTAVAAFLLGWLLSVVGTLAVIVGATR